MANSVRFRMSSAAVVTINGDDPLINGELTESTVKDITVAGDPWVVFDSYCYGGDFKILRVGKDQPFPKLKDRVIKSMRMIKGGIHKSQVTLHDYPFFSGPKETIHHNTPQIEGTYFSLKVDDGAVIFFDEEHYAGGKSILLKGDEVQNYNAVKLTSIGKSVKPVTEVWP